jgi:hypothetical protein
MDILSASADALARAGFGTTSVSVEGTSVLLFEDPTVLGFLLAFSDARDLITRSTPAADIVLKKYQFGLRRAGKKAWNAYLVLLAAASSHHAESAALSAIEEDLTGTRKIARAGISGVSDLEAALLPLLQLQSAPRLDAVDIVAEIRERTTTLPVRAVDAFLSHAEEAVVLQVLEEEVP